ncbi:methionyl-tRNA formyltransferase [Candidatus Omnitrophota bacterium]
MKILALVSRENTYQPHVYEQLLKERRDEFIGIVTVPFVTKGKSTLGVVRFLFDLYGLLGFLRKTMQVCKNKLLDTASRYSAFQRCYSLKAVARKYDIPLFNVEDINSKETIQLLESLKPDLIISSQGHFLSERLRVIPQLGVINKHAGRLPKYRGVYPVFWAMLNNEKEVGVTIHYVNEIIDGGGILLQEVIPIENNDTFESLYKKVIALTPKLFIRTIDMIRDGRVDIKKNNMSEATVFSYPSKEDISKLKNSGKKII